MSSDSALGILNILKNIIKPSSLNMKCTSPSCFKKWLNVKISLTAWCLRRPDECVWLLGLNTHTHTWTFPEWEGDNFIPYSHDINVFLPFSFLTFFGYSGRNVFHFLTFSLSFLENKEMNVSQEKYEQLYSSTGHRGNKVTPKEVPNIFYISSDLLLRGKILIYVFWKYCTDTWRYSH